MKRQSQLQTGPQLIEQVQNLGLNRDVQSGDRFVGDNEIGLQRKRSRNTDALALSAGEFVWVASREKPYPGPPSPSVQRLSCQAEFRSPMPHAQRLGNDCADRHSRIE